MRNLHTIIIHCSATKPNWMAGKGVHAKRDEIDRWHKARGWKGIGYHFVLDRTRDIAKGRDLNTVGAHVKGHNTGTIGICLVGGQWPDGRWGLKSDSFSDHFTPQQDAALRKLLTDLCEAHPSINHIKGHNDYTDQKGCPSFDVNEWLKDEPQKHTEPHVEPPAPKHPGGGLMGFLAALFAFFMRPSKKPVQKLGPQGFVPVPHEGRTIWVMPDFHKDKHGMRLPVTGIDALRLAQEKSRAVGFPLTLPTKEMVDSIHKAADVRLLMPTRSDKRQAMATYRSVDAEIETARRGRSGLLFGHKKEILRPLVKGKVTIYGGMRSASTFWETRPQSAHSEHYTDYSHGLRLVYDPEGE
jgi:N-acetylmuramoyl-L-alanine amidase